MVRREVEIERWASLRVQKGNVDRAELTRGLLRCSIAVATTVTGRGDDKMGTSEKRSQGRERWSKRQEKSTEFRSCRLSWTLNSLALRLPLFKLQTLPPSE